MRADWDNTPLVELHCECSKKIAGSMTIGSVKEAGSLNPLHGVITAKVIWFSLLFAILISSSHASELLIWMNAHEKQT